ncbi:MAG: LemA family protein, partial [Planctomycetota bacterium]
AWSTGGIVTLIAGAVILLWLVWTFNGFVRLGNKVKEAFSGVDVQLKRRSDLVPNLVRVVKGYAAHERETLEEVVQARGAADAAEDLTDRARRENGLSRSLDKLFALVERYPELKADKNFRKLHHDLVEIEDHLQYARRYYNGTVRDYNTKTQQFPANVLAGILALKSREFFEIDSASERDAPTIHFDEED